LVKRNHSHFAKKIRNRKEKRIIIKEKENTGKKEQRKGEVREREKGKK